MNKLVSTKICVFIMLVGPSETEKSQLIYIFLKIGTFQPKVDKIGFLNQRSQPLSNVMQENHLLEFVQDVNFQYKEPLENNGAKYLVIFDDSYGELCNSKAFFENAISGRHHGLSTIYIQRNSFHQSKLGRDVELQSTHIVLFKYPHDVMQVSTLSEQLGLRSGLVDCIQGAKSLSYGHSLIDLSTPTDDRLHFCTNNGSVPSKFCIPDWLKQSKNWTTKTKLFFSPSFPMIFPQRQEALPSA